MGANDVDFKNYSRDINDFIGMNDASMIIQKFKNNHWKSFTIASALLENESQDSFVWACEAFKRTFVEPPKCIVTDQCGAIKIAI